jgi:hypothetical protein
LRYSHGAVHRPFGDYTVQRFRRSGCDTRHAAGILPRGNDRTSLACELPPPSLSIRTLSGMPAAPEPTV